MKAIILSAGQGKRLLPYTENTPKCLLQVGRQTVLEWQIDALLAAGVETITVIAGYGLTQVESLLTQRFPGGQVRILFNPFYQLADNLASCWMARGEMDGQLLIINGDTLFHPDVLGSLLAAPQAPILLTVDRKESYDADDMKVHIDRHQRVTRVSKQLDPATVDAESIGMLRFSTDGTRAFVQAVEQFMRTPEGLRLWYLSIIDQLAAQGLVRPHSIEGLPWGELDYPPDLEQARRMAVSW